MKVRIVIGRFQPLHNGHVNLINAACSDTDKTVIIVGSSDKYGTKSNPFTFQQREALLRSLYIDPSIDVLPLPDHVDDEKWLESLVTLVGAHTDSNDTVVAVVCNKDDETSKSNEIYTSFYDSVEVDMAVNISATEIRKAYFDGSYNHLVGLFPDSTKSFLDNEYQSVVNTCEIVCSQISNTDAIKSIEDVLEELQQPLNEWQKSIMYSYIDERYVPCQCCDIFKPPSEFNCVTTKDVYELMDITCIGCNKS